VKRLVLVVASGLFWIFFLVSSTALFAGALLVWALTRPFDPNGRVLHAYTCAWGQLYFWVNPLWRLEVRGREKLPRRGPAVLVANHQSLGDILVLHGLYRPFKWVSKAENFRIPLVGWNMRLNRYVPLVRGERQSTARMMDACRFWLDRGVPVMFFPEGTRSPDGEVRAFKEGAFRLAVEKGCPVFPIAVAGTMRTVPKYGLTLAGRADCRVHVLDPIDPADVGGDAGALRDLARDRIVAEKARIEGGRPAAGTGTG
jgi:1-acyl-sn-glycerol-3-phosphate acyltransferase